MSRGENTREVTEHHVACGEGRWAGKRPPEQAGACSEGSGSLGFSSSSEFLAHLTGL